MALDPQFLSRQLSLVFQFQYHKAVLEAMLLKITFLSFYYHLVCFIHYFNLFLKHCPP